MEISRYLRQHARTIAGKSQLFINSYAKALEVCILEIEFSFQLSCEVIFSCIFSGMFCRSKCLDCRC